jgi:hypothetical protein
MLNLRSSISIKQNMPVFQVLWVGACLKMLLEGVAALEWRDGGGINGRRAGLSHFVVWEMSIQSIGFAAVALGTVWVKWEQGNGALKQLTLTYCPWQGNAANRTEGGT